MTVGYLLENMTSAELAMWAAYAKVENEEWDKRMNKNKDGTATLDDDSKESKEIKQQIFESNVRAKMERQGVRVRKMNVA